MEIVVYIISALIADALIGDPRWLPHPVRLIGRCALAVEPLWRRIVRAPRAAGIAATATIVIGTGLVGFALLRGAFLLHPWLGHGLSVYLIYASIAARDLSRHSRRVSRLLSKGDLQGARMAVAMMVGRDTDRLDEEGVVRATVESVAENIVDGVTAPLFYAAIGGPLGAILYRAVNTLDSTFGYKNEQYLEFGWAPARLDDLANWIPARLTAPFVAAAALLLGKSGRRSWLIMVRDRRRHASPNSGYTEAAVAGALGMQLGGRNYYFGEASDKPLIGEPRAPLIPRRIPETNHLMWATVLSFVAFCLAARLLACYLGEV
jgi:adenosylcobinamide-phosphate synthase